MVAHFIHFKGRGAWVAGMPVLIAFILFMIFDLLSLNSRHIRDFSLILSSVFLFLIDNSGTTVNEGVIQRTGKRRKGINTFMWIEMRYWAIAWGLLGLILFFFDIK